MTCISDKSSALGGPATANDQLPLMPSIIPSLAEKRREQKCTRSFRVGRHTTQSLGASTAASEPASSYIVAKGPDHHPLSPDFPCRIPIWLLSLCWRPGFGLQLLSGAPWRSLSLGGFAQLAHAPPQCKLGTGCPRPMTARRGMKVLVISVPSMVLLARWHAQGWAAWYSLPS